MMNTMEFGKKESVLIKGVAILCMIFFHTLDFPELLNDNMYKSIWMVNNEWPIEKVIASFGNVCVAIYSFMAGYGLEKSYGGNKQIVFSVLDRIFKLMQTYWIIFLLFVPLGLVLRYWTFDISGFLLAFSGIKINYNATWWFLPLYVIFCFTYILIRKCRLNLLISLSICMLFFVLSCLIINSDTTLALNIKRLDYYAFIRYNSIFLLGIFFCRFNLFVPLLKYLSLLLKKYGKVSVLTFLICFCLIFRDIMSWKLDPLYADFFIVPILIMIVCALTDSIFTRFMYIMGKHSTNMWLIHAFFVFYYLSFIGFFPYFSLLCFIWVLFLSYLFSLLVNTIRAKIFNH